VRLNDVFFAAHASCINLLTLAQCAAYDRGSQRVHARTRTAFALAVPATAADAAAVWLLPDAFPVLWCARPRACRLQPCAPACARAACACTSCLRLSCPRIYRSASFCITRAQRGSEEAPWGRGPACAALRAARPAAQRARAAARRFLYYLSYIKVAVATAMYLPQVLLNHCRRSTSGFSIAQARRQAVRLQPDLFCSHLPCAVAVGCALPVSRVLGAVTLGAPSRAGAVRLCGRVAVPVPAVS